jgi:hypothetical protein
VTGPFAGLVYKFIGFFSEVGAAIIVVVEIVLK